MDININFSDGMFGITDNFRIASFELDVHSPTAKKDANRILRSQIYENPLFESLLDSLNVGINIVGIDRTVLFVNKEQSRIHNIPKEEYVGKVIDDITPMSGHIHVLRTGIKYQHEELTIRMKKPVNVRTICLPIVDKNDVLLGSFGLAKALSDYREIMLEVKSLRDINGRFSYMYHDMAEPIVALDIMGKVLYANPNFIALYGKEDGKVVNTTLNSKEINDIVKTTLSDSNKTYCHFIPIKGSQYKVISFPFALDSEVKGCICMLRECVTAGAPPAPVVISSDVPRYSFYSKDDLSAPFKKIIGKNSILMEQLLIADRAAVTNCRVLITGGSGVGKELVARAIHHASNRASGPFIALNCAAVPDNLLESELFGYEEGAFTGAKKGGKPGKFELANKGTIFLDEIGDMPLYMQAKLLRILEDMENERVGGTEKSKLDVRVISATNYDLRKKIAEGKFREDLFYRIKVVSILMPDLKDRREDIPLLVKYFLNEFCAKYQKKVSISDEAMKTLKSYDWPGNVRELKNIIENTVVLSGSPLIQPYHLPYAVWNERGQSTTDDTKEGDPDTKAKALLDIVSETEKQAIIKALSENHNNRTKTMKALGISRRTFYDKLNKYNIDPLDGDDHSHSL